MRQTRPSISPLSIRHRSLLQSKSYLLDISKCDVECPHCGALYWMHELSTKGTRRNSSFSTCCGDSAIQLPVLHDAHPYLTLSTVILSTADVLIHLYMALPCNYLNCLPTSMCYFHQPIIISITTKPTSSKR